MCEGRRREFRPPCIPSSPRKEAKKSADQPSDEEILGIFTRARSSAIVGLSGSPDRPSHRVARFLKDVGYEICTVDPHVEGAGGRAYRLLEDIPTQIDAVILTAETCEASSLGAWTSQLAGRRHSESNSRDSAGLG